MPQSGSVTRGVGLKREQFLLFCEEITSLGGLKGVQPCLAPSGFRSSSIVGKQLLARKGTSSRIYQQE